uniref:Uncharacterized protein n=1 Tax=Anguilla anguilla TaxID=7936 RepID=A0A0E9QD05_ANGAN
MLKLQQTQVVINRS